MPRFEPHPRIVVGVDGSDGSRTALVWALQEARERGGSVTVVLVWDDPYAVVGPPAPPTAAGPEYDRLRLVLDRAVADAIGELPGEPIVVRKRIVSGHPAEMLAAAAESADLLVVGSRGRSGLRGILLGSVSQRCALLSRVPVVIVPAAVQGARGAGSAAPKDISADADAEAGAGAPTPPFVSAP